MGREADAASFRAPADPYDRLMGRYARSLAPAFVSELGLEAGARVLDVGCGPGALTAALAGHVGAERVDFEDFWEPFTTGVGPSGSYCASLDDERRSALREECARRLGSPGGPFELSARAWMVQGTR